MDGEEGSTRWHFATHGTFLRELDNERIGDEAVRDQALYTKLHSERTIKFFPDG
jgi:hypothetical protein